MKKLTTLTLTAAVAMVAGLGFGPAGSFAGIVDQPAPLRVTVSSKDGKKTLKAAKKIATTVSCSKDCRARIKVRLKLPQGVVKDATKFNIPAGRIAPLVLRLNSVGAGYLKSGYRSAKYVVRVSATDVATGKTVVKVRSFGFRR